MQQRSPIFSTQWCRCAFSRDKSSLLNMKTAWGVIKGRNVLMCRGIVKGVEVDTCLLL